MSTRYDANITIVFPKNRRITKYIKAIGSMDNAKKRAKKIADSMDLKPIDYHWKVEKTKFAENSGLHGSWESKATRNYIRKSGRKIKIIITRA